MTQLDLQRGTEGDGFVLYMERFMQHTRIMKDKLLSLVLNNQKPHLVKKFTDIAKENALVIFPPHISLKLQPLDRSVYGPYKKFVNILWHVDQKQSWEN
jgi:hypothetical protein